MAPLPGVFEPLPQGAASASRILQAAPVGSFLVRESRSGEKQDHPDGRCHLYAIDVKSLLEVAHVRISASWSASGKNYALVGQVFQNQFSSIEDLVDFYSRQKLSWLPIKNDLRV